MTFCTCICRWNIVIHGGVDGYSRLPVYLKASNNNRAETVFVAFHEACMEYGVPERVRSDKGGENIKVAEYMLEAKGTGHGSFIVGRSVHNQRFVNFLLSVHQADIIFISNCSLNE